MSGERDLYCGEQDIADRVGVSLETVQRWRQRHQDFPAPVPRPKQAPRRVLPMLPTFLWTDVRDWLADNIPATKVRAWLADRSGNLECDELHPRQPHLEGRRADGKLIDDPLSRIIEDDEIRRRLEDDPRGQDPASLQ